MSIVRFIVGIALSVVTVFYGVAGWFLFLLVVSAWLVPLCGPIQESDWHLCTRFPVLSDSIAWILGVMLISALSTLLGGVIVSFRNSERVLAVAATSMMSIFSYLFLFMWPKNMTQIVFFVLVFLAAVAGSLGVLRVSMKYSGEPNEKQRESI